MLPGGHIKGGVEASNTYPTTRGLLMRNDHRKGQSMPIVSSGFDWLTVTEVDGKFTEELFQTAMRIEKGEAGNGHTREDWSAMGYVGFKTGALKYGERRAVEGIMILSGPLAEKAGYSPKIRADRVTRVDVQVTVRLDPPDPLLASRLQRKLQKIYRGKKRKPFLSLLQDQTGDTLYVGKRGNDISLRFYDKSFQMNEQLTGVCWRYEVQYRREPAKKAMRLIKTADNPNLTVVGLIASEFEKRSIVVGFSSVHSVSAIEMGRELTTNDGKIAWLEKCVAPVITQLCFAGYEEQVINALSLRAIIAGVKEFK